ncbi:hypothetical protein Bache_1954 [Bacteroides helcogenes P 36-108]|uniref:BT4734-like N-terminal domain-containing protein n=1 Tax=Bacteroides helcogenes (strain ATCC 35417 / DSM 20613 / JCM 6297 / CCUG 15421 / P 36-108) TaxID=693979 RepID=E6SQ73_BACT6|nr:hypothetical protein Bache_1954 [Bacteroides helcogenes P 36-108]
MNEFKMSLFQNPIAPQRDAQGRILKPATLTPVMEVSPAEVHQLITCNEPLRIATGQVRQAADVRAAKASLLPYVTPCGVFSRRNCQSLLHPSGLVVIDIDHLDSLQEAERMRRTLFDDAFLRPTLCFVSPGGRGVKAFIPYRTDILPDCAPDAAEQMFWAMNYVELTYGGSQKDRLAGKGIDTSGKDIVRACFLCHDPEALLRKGDLEGVITPLRSPRESKGSYRSLCSLKELKGVITPLRSVQGVKGQ